MRRAVLGVRRKRNCSAWTTSPWVCTLCWKCGVDDNLSARRNNSGRGRSRSVTVFIIAAAGGRDVHRGGRRPTDRPTERITDTDQAWLPRRQHRALAPLCCSHSAKLSIFLSIRCGFFLVFFEVGENIENTRDTTFNAVKTTYDCVTWAEADDAHRYSPPTSR